MERDILGFIGIAPIREMLIGNADSPDPAGRRKWLAKLRTLGEAGD